MYAFSLALFLLTRTNVSFCASNTHVRSPIRTSTHVSELTGISPVAAWMKIHTLARSHPATLPLPPLPLQTHPSSGLPHKRPCTTPTPHTHLLCSSISFPLETYYRRHGPPAPTNHVKYFKGAAEMPFPNWCTANTHHFHFKMKNPS